MARGASCRELVDHRRVDHLGQGARDLDPGRPAADDHEIDGALVGQVRIGVGLLEGLDDPRLEAFRVVEGVEREGVLRPGRPEEVRLGAGGQDEVVAGVRLAVARRHGPGHRIDGHDLGTLGIELVELGRDLAQRVGDVAGRQHRGRDLVQERLELVVVVLVDERDVQVLARGELPGTGDAGEPAADDDDACPRGGRRHAWSEKRGAAARRPTRVGGAESRTSVRRLTRRMVVASVTSVDCGAEVGLEERLIAPGQRVAVARAQGILGDGPDDLLEPFARIGGPQTACDRIDPHVRRIRPSVSQRWHRHTPRSPGPPTPSIRPGGRRSSRATAATTVAVAVPLRWDVPGPHHTAARRDCLPRDARRAGR